jgi:hypothetical protein
MRGCTAREALKGKEAPVNWLGQPLSSRLAISIGAACSGGLRWAAILVPLRPHPRPPPGALGSQWRRSCFWRRLARFLLGSCSRRLMFSTSSALSREHFNCKLD